MKKFEELSIEEKKSLKTEFKLSSFGKYIRFTEFYNDVFVIILFLFLFTNILSEMSLLGNLLIFVLLIGSGVFNSYKKKSLIKEYYELKNNK